MKNQNKRFNNEGLTLIELITVIVILGIIATVAVPKTFAYVKKARINTLLSNIDTLNTAIVVDYQSDSDTYTCSVNGCDRVDGDDITNGPISKLLDRDIKRISIHDAYFLDTKNSDGRVDLVYIYIDPAGSKLSLDDLKPGGSWIKPFVYCDGSYLRYDLQIN